MAESRRYGLGAQLDIEQILLEAQNRWLRPAEICEILRNYNKFRISPEPANKPPNGSLFLFDRKVLRYFRKDGHNWRKKKDGKTIKEAHERLKAGSIDVLHCYYAHGEDNENFQRRSYWLLEEEMSHIVLVHYREVKGNRTHYNRNRGAEGAVTVSLEEESIPNSDTDSSLSSKFQQHGYHVPSQTTDTTSLNSTQASEYTDAESAYSHLSSSGFPSFHGAQQSEAEKMDDALSVPYHPVLSNDYQGNFQAIPEMDFVSLAQTDIIKDNFGDHLTYDPQKYLDFPLWENEFGNGTSRTQSVPFIPLDPSSQPATNIIPGQGNEMLSQVSADTFDKNQEFGNHPHGREWQCFEGDSSMEQKLRLGSTDYQNSRFYDGRVSSSDLLVPLEPQHTNEQSGQLAAAELGSSVKAELDSNLAMGREASYSTLKKPLLGGIMKDGLKKLDSFDRWMSNELGDVNESQMQSSSETYWEEVGGDDSNISSQVGLDTYTISPSLSQDQLYSIIDFSPNRTYSGTEAKVLITGRFLKSHQDVVNCRWACMFGELEVPAEVVADGVLRCRTPHHEAGRVPFYVTCANRQACSEIREFEFQAYNLRHLDSTDLSSNNSSETLLHMRFGKLLLTGSDISDKAVPLIIDDNSDLSNKLSSLIKDDSEWEQILMLTNAEEFSTEKVRDRFVQKLLKEKLHAWLLQKVAEGGKGPSVLDEGGQGVLHFAAALGYDWAIPPTVAAGVSINFRDVNGWTALHWAASYGRERTVAFLISQGAAAGALTDPTPKYPRGRTPADLASANGHKGMAGYVAECALSSHLTSLNLKDANNVDAGDITGKKAVQTVAERTATPISDGDFQHGLSLKDSLAAVCNASQAAARIHQVFRAQSFQKKQQKEYDDSQFVMSDEHALSLLAVKTNRAGHHDEPVHAAATRIQNKFRSYKGRKDFLIFRQRVVKIQAHVRGHQVRKNYKKIIWSVGILDKVILRWKRKGRGLSGFKPEAHPEDPGMQATSSKEDDYDFLKEGRKQTEERLQKALARVKSMVQYPEARDQYRRLLNVVSEIQESKATNDGTTDITEEATAATTTDDFDDDLVDLEALLGDDTFMFTEV